jgi:hypothetical protein
MAIFRCRGVTCQESAAPCNVVYIPLILLPLVMVINHNQRQSEVLFNKRTRNGVALSAETHKSDKFCYFFLWWALHSWYTINIRASESILSTHCLLKIYVGKTQGNKPLRRSMQKWKDSVTIYLREITFESVNCNELGSG